MLDSLHNGLAVGADELRCIARSGDFCAIFWGVGLGDFAGVFEEMWCLHVVFCGQYVVESAVSLVSGPVLFRGWKFGTFSGFIFDDSRFGNEPQGVGLQVGWNVCT